MPRFVVWWAPRESNTAPTDYESAALTKHELGARIKLLFRQDSSAGWLWRREKFPRRQNTINRPRGSS